MEARGGPSCGLLSGQGQATTWLCRTSRCVLPTRSTLNRCNLCPDTLPWSCSCCHRCLCRPGRPWCRRSTRRRCRQLHARPLCPRGHAPAQHLLPLLHAPQPEASRPSPPSVRPVHTAHTRAGPMLLVATGLCARTCRNLGSNLPNHGSLPSCSRHVPRRDGPCPLCSTCTCACPASYDPWGVLKGPLACKLCQVQSTG